MGAPASTQATKRVPTPSRKRCDQTTRSRFGAKIAPARKGLTNSLSTPCEVGSEATAVVDSAGADDVDGLSVELGELALADVDAGGDEDARGDVAGVSSTLAGLGADDVAAGVDGLLDVLGVPDHVHDRDAGLVQGVDRPLGGHADGGDEEAGFLLDDDLDEFRELALGVVVLRVDQSGSSAELTNHGMRRRTLVLRALPPT